MIPFPRWTDDDKKNVPLQYAGWSPKGSGLTFVYQNNLYYQQSPDHTPYQVGVWMCGCGYVGVWVWVRRCVGVGVRVWAGKCVDEWVLEYWRVGVGLCGGVVVCGCWCVWWCGCVGVWLCFCVVCVCVGVLMCGYVGVGRLVCVGVLVCVVCMCVNVLVIVHLL